jgi:hypothetical protein
MDAESTAFPEEARLPGDITDQVIYLDIVKNSPKSARMLSLQKLWLESNRVYKQHGPSEKVLMDFTSGKLRANTEIRRGQTYSGIQIVQSAFAKHGLKLDWITAGIASSDVYSRDCKSVVESKTWQANPPSVIEGKVASAFIQKLLSGTKNKRGSTRETGSSTEEKESFDSGSNSSGSSGAKEVIKNFATGKVHKSIQEISNENYRS